MDLVDIIAISHNHTKAFNPTAILQLMLLFILLQVEKEIKFLAIRQLVNQVVNLFPMASVGPTLVCQIVMVYLQHLQTEASQAIVEKGGVVSKSVILVHHIMACKTYLMAHLYRQLLAALVFHIEILIDTFHLLSSMSMALSILDLDSSHKHVQHLYHTHVRDYAHRFLQVRHKSPHVADQSEGLEDTMVHVIRNSGCDVCRGACHDVFHGVLHNDHHRYSGGRARGDDHDDNLG